MASDSLLNVFVVFSIMTSPSGKLASFVSLSNVKELNIRIELALVLVITFLNDELIWVRENQKLYSTMF